MEGMGIARIQNRKASTMERTRRIRVDRTPIRVTRRKDSRRLSSLRESFMCGSGLRYAFKDLGQFPDFIGNALLPKVDQENYQPESAQEAEEYTQNQSEDVRQ